MSEGADPTSVDDANFLGDVGIAVLLDELAQMLVNFLSLLRRSDFTRANRPNRLIGNDHAAVLVVPDFL